MKAAMVAMLIMLVTLLTVHDMNESRHAKTAAAERAVMLHQLEGLRTDVSDLKQTADALGVVCVSRGMR